MAHADILTYNALKVMTESEGIVAVLKVIDPKALAQARDAIQTFEEEHAPEGREYVVDLYVPFSCVTPAGAAETLDGAAGLAQSIFASENLYERLLEALDGSVFGRSDSAWRTEVGEA